MPLILADARYSSRALESVCPYSDHNCWIASGAECVSNGIQVIIEEVGVDVEDHGRRGLAEHLLRCLHIGTLRDRQARRGVPPVMLHEPHEVWMKLEHLCHRRLKASGAKVLIPDGATTYIPVTANERYARLELEALREIASLDAELERLEAAMRGTQEVSRDVGVLGLVTSYRERIEHAQPEKPRLHAYLESSGWELRDLEHGQTEANRVAS